MDSKLPKSGVHQQMQVFAGGAGLANIRSRSFSDTFASLSMPERYSQLMEIAMLINNNGLGNTYEPQSMFVEPGHAFSDDELAKIISAISGMDKTQLQSLGFTLIDPQLVKQYMSSKAVSVGEGSSAAERLEIMASGQPDPKVALLDKFYGIATVLLENRWRQMHFADAVWNHRIIGMPEELISNHLKTNIFALSEGVMLAREILYQNPAGEVQKSLNAFTVPVLVAESEDELQQIIARFALAMESAPPGFQLWFRGQSQDYLMPDRSMMVANGIAPYSNIRDSSFVPSLYRSIDPFLQSPAAFSSLVQEICEWNLIAQRLLPASFSILDIQGKPYTCKPVPMQARAVTSMYFAGKPHLDLPGLRDLGPYSHFQIYDEEDNLLDEYIKLNNPSLQAHQSSILLQHYGCPTSWLDITKDIEIAKWFALHRLNKARDGHFTPTRTDWPGDNPDQWPTIYVFALNPEVQPVIDTSAILSGTDFLRPHAQKCGLLGAAGNFARNYGARFIATKIRLGPQFRKQSVLPVDTVFPDGNDQGLANLLDLYLRSKSIHNFPVYTVGEV